MRLCLLGKRKRVGPFLGAKPVCCHVFRVYTCKRASSGGKSPEEAVKSNAAVHGISFHNGFTIHPFPAKVNRPSHLFSRKSSSHTCSLDSNPMQPVFEERKANEYQINASFCFPFFPFLSCFFRHIVYNNLKLRIP